MGTASREATTEGCVSRRTAWWFASPAIHASLVIWILVAHWTGPLQNIGYGFEVVLIGFLALPWTFPLVLLAGENEVLFAAVAVANVLLHVAGIALWRRRSMSGKTLPERPQNRRARKQSAQATTTRCGQ